MRPRELPLEITWLIQYPPMAYQPALARLIEHYGRDAVAAELAKRVAAGANVVSIAKARSWWRPQQRRKPRFRQWPGDPAA